MIYIIEGPDGTGKTTLATYLSKMTGYPIRHRSNPKTAEEKATMYKMYHEDIVKSNNVIWDRAFYSEIVYGKVMRDDICISIPQMYKFEVMLSVKGAILIHCTDEAHLSYVRAAERGEDYVTCIQDHSKITEEFRKLMNKDHLIPVVEYRVKEFIKDE